MTKLKCIKLLHLEYAALKSGVKLSVRSNGVVRITECTIIWQDALALRLPVTEGGIKLLGV